MQSLVPQSGVSLNSERFPLEDFEDETSEAISLHFLFSGDSTWKSPQKSFLFREPICRVQPFWRGVWQFPILEPGNPNASDSGYFVLKSSTATGLEKHPPVLWGFILQELNAWNRLRWWNFKDFWFFFYPNPWGKWSNSTICFKWVSQPPSRIGWIS